jgi:hypothetical protein
MRYPKHAYPSARAFRAAKRRAVRQALETLTDDDGIAMGCMYLPEDGYETVCRIRDDLNRLRKQLSVKEWGR